MADDGRPDQAREGARVPADFAMGDEAAGAAAATLRALADPLRLRMLSLIASAPGAEATAGDLASVAAVSQPTVSHHLKLLRDAGVLTSERRGTSVHYRVDPAVRAAVSTLLNAVVPAVLEAGRPGPERGAAVDADVDRLVAAVAPDFADLEPSAVAAVVRESYLALVLTGGRAEDLVPDAERFARQRLADIRRVAAPAGDDVPQVLFVCVSNTGRSQLAAALTRRYAGDAVRVRSAGSAPAAAVGGAVMGLLGEDGADADAFAKPLTDDALRAADVVVTMGCGDACPVLDGKRYEEWPLGDPGLASPRGLRAIRDEIDRRVRLLVGDLAPHVVLPQA
ncbi:metalloregulator ArsR/SmtB family transcription factor [Cellulomonas pakistanensis]|uniref:HTH arsR-type domain-containing protein n=1 Tax=Cellulomonas pakistanensis TaxID=992287 RepID=A0A919U7B8_9CELL|nr:metalloregulator ArsR/SmtB family transcription factor [Cellulomonas pakistanensis]GIG36822.1 hypothetical protein Cpa01nite_22030 [Cellulomonas pakistanensis]